MRCCQCRGSCSCSLSRCPDCLGFFCDAHTRPEDHAFLAGKSETCAARTVRLMRVFESGSVAVQDRSGN